MCGVIGINSIDYIDPNLIKKLLEQTRIRGLHATGVSFIYNRGTNGTPKIKRALAPHPP